MKKLFYAGFLVLMLLPLVSVSGADSLFFGPEAFDRSEGSPNVFDESFAATSKAGFLIVFNGDDEQDSRVTSGSITLNGVQVVAPDELTVDTERITKAVDLENTNSMQITLDGEEGVGYIIVLVVKDKKLIPEFTAGRLHLAWTSIADANAIVNLRLKNGSFHFDRRFKIRFYNEDGSLAAVSAKQQLNQHASVNATVQSYLPSGATWQTGSLEIIFVGRGGGKVLGYAVQTNGSGQTETDLPLQGGGVRHFFNNPKK
jgi:hypothetical protein